MAKAKAQIETYQSTLKGLKSLKRRKALGKKVQRKQHQIADCAQTLVKEEARSL
jgi:hypothetical protein